MTISAQDILDFVDNLLNKHSEVISNYQINPETFYRSLISRLYFYVFHRAKDELLARGIYIPRTGKAHSIIKKELRKRDRYLGDLYKDLRDKRNEADYDIKNKTITLADILDIRNKVKVLII